ncbi:aldehyde dehydrogenase [Streptomyces sulfonofaciens]|uniref:Aldehyde dehydrogenase n=1 Tax=Streptomyces sulfonofaciens TaxID=68272 RepID=A0A919GDC9_9ACTN|nr:aldehyde dehydrogenase [Streptomyces sulfonofaciens]GHH82098.1 aldehyde dehydrogenase [Streptomyces sulfonofaciens]
MNTTESLYLDGHWASSRSPGREQERITLLSASTEEVLGTVALGGRADADAAVAAARAAFDAPDGWAHWEPSRRGEALDRLADALQRRAELISRAVSAQNGMPITVSRQLESWLTGVIVRYYAELARTAPFEESRPHVVAGTTTVYQEPVGVVAAIPPSNFPQSLAATKYAPALAAGCTVILKPSPSTLLDAFHLMEAAAEAGLPPGVLNLLPVTAGTAAYLVGHPGVDMVAFTGSTAVGRRIAEICAPLLRPVTLELGGKSAAIVLDDADLDLSVMGERLYSATLLNNGQTCFLSTRVLAPRSRYAEVVDAFAALASSLRVGDALDPDTQMGPVVSRAQRDRVVGRIGQARADGARLVVGGGRPAGLDKGWFVEPTVFADVDNGSRLAREEVFGPVLSVIPYDDEEQAVRLANDSEYGLAGTVWSADPERAGAVARRMRTGSVGINGYLPDPGAPFGGVKRSGIGRELGPHALARYQQPKSVFH